MAREINIGSKNFTKVVAMDERGVGNANHEYFITMKNEKKCNTPDNISHWDAIAEIKFQKGAVKEVGINGIHNEDLIAIVIDRLQGFQSGDFSCRENEFAITKLEEALLWLNKRTQDRQNRGVEGYSIK